MIEFVRNLQDRLDARADPRTRRWWERYLRGQASFRGVPMDGVRQCVHAWYDAHDIGRVLTPRDRFRLTDRLVRQAHTEDKLAAVLLLQERLIPAGEIDSATALGPMAAWFDDGHLADWNVVDWTCVKAVAALVERDGRPAARAVLAWSTTPNLWRARASIVTFANLAGRGGDLYPGFVDDLLEACDLVVRRPERFAKTGVGWVLRTLSDPEPTRVLSFVEERLVHFSAESLRNALKRLPGPRAGALRAQHGSLRP